MREADIQKAILDYLAARGVLAFRMNVGASVSEHRGKTRMLRYGVPGMADILAFPILDYGPHPVWLEVKGKTKQTDLQKSFERQVCDHMHTYAVVNSVEDVETLLGALGL